MRKPFGVLVEELRDLPAEDWLIPMGELAGRLDVPLDRLRDAADALKMLRGDPAYISVRPSPEVYLDPVIVWLSELHPQKIPRAEPPPGPFTVTRSEAVIRPQGASVHIWWAVMPAVPVRTLTTHEVRRPDGSH
jgi:hypothetical protein